MLWVCLTQFAFYLEKRNHRLAGFPCRRHWLKLLLVFKREFTAGQTSVLPVCLPLTESSGSSLCDRQFYQSVELLKHKTPGIPVCLQPQRAKRHRPHWVTASALLFSRTLSPPPPNTPLPCFSISLCTCLSFFLPLYNHLIAAIASRLWWNIHLEACRST